VTAMLVAGNTLLNPTEKRAEASCEIFFFKKKNFLFLTIFCEDSARKLFHHRLGDHLTLRNIFREYLMQEKHRKTWCRKHFVNYRGIENAKLIYEQLVQYSVQQLGHQDQPILAVITLFFFFVVYVSYFPVF
jgi:HrpA-like RNA helicase